VADAVDLQNFSLFAAKFDGLKFVYCNGLSLLLINVFSEASIDNSGHHFFVYPGLLFRFYFPRRVVHRGNSLVDHSRFYALGRGSVDLLYPLPVPVGHSAGNHSVFCSAPFFNLIFIHQGRPAVCRTLVCGYAQHECTGVLYQTSQI